MKRVEPLSNVKPYWDVRHDRYPNRVRLAMSDGTIQTYVIEAIQPTPVVNRGWTNIGYAAPLDEYKPKHLKGSDVR